MILFFKAISPDFGENLLILKTPNSPKSLKKYPLDFLVMILVQGI